MSYTVIKRWNDSRASLAQRHFEKTGKRTSPYQSLPERETYDDYEVREYADGTQRIFRREISRWGGSYSLGDWKES